MKIAVVFLLVAVSTSYGHVRQSSGHVAHHGYGEVPNTDCLHKILKTDLKNLLTTLQALFCSYETCKEKQGTPNACSLDEWTEMLEQARITLTDLGCAVDQIALGGTPTVEKITEEVGKTLEKLRDPIRDLLIKLEIEQPAFDLLCKLLGDILPKLAEILDGLGDVLNIVPVNNLLPVNSLLKGTLGGLL